MKRAANGTNQSGIVREVFGPPDFRVFSISADVQFWSILSALLGNWQILRLDGQNVYTNRRELSLLTQCNMNPLLFFFHAFPMEFGMYVDIRNWAAVLYKKRRKSATFHQLLSVPSQPKVRAKAGFVFRGNRLIFKQARRIGLTTMVVLLSGCTAGQMKVGDRPFLYPQGPADPPSTIVNQAGVIGKADPNAPQQTTASNSAGAQSTATSGGVMTAVQRPSWAVAQAPAAAAPTAAAPAVVGTATGVASAPAGEVPGGYTQATRYGDMLFISGQIALDPRTGALTADATIEGQAKQAMENVRAIIESNRLTMANVVSVTIFVTNINTLPQVDRVYHSYFKGNLPARSVVQVAGLPRGSLLEISAVAGR